MITKKNISIFFCTGFGIGFFPYFPGTLASLIILPICWFLKSNYNTEIFIFTICIYSLISFFLLKIMLANKKNRDPKYVVCDEYIGQAIALIFCDEKILDYLIAFLLFRFLDIFKPFPISYFDKLKSVSAVILDDVLAGIMVTFIFIIYYGV